MKVPLADPKRQLQGEVGKRTRAAIARVVRSGMYASGPEVPAFEEEWAAYCGAQYAVGLSSCSDALYLCVRYAKLFDRSHVATTPLSFWATTEAALRARAIVDFVDIDPATGCMEHGINREDTINLPVDLYGVPSGVRGYRIEDCAQSHGLKWPSEAEAVGLLARCYSFYPTKNLGAMGMAGAVVTNDKQLYDWLRMMRTHGEHGGRFVHQQVSGNWRMDEIQAAILRAKLPELNSWTTWRRYVAARYTAALEKMGVPFLDVANMSAVWHIFPVFTDRADALIAHLKKNGVDAGKRYPVPLHLQPGAGFMNYKADDFPNAERWCREVVNLPIFETMRDDEVEYVIAKVQEFFK